MKQKHGMSAEGERANEGERPPVPVAEDTIVDIEYDDDVGCCEIPTTEDDCEIVIEWTLVILAYIFINVGFFCIEMYVLTMDNRGEMDGYVIATFFLHALAIVGFGVYPTLDV